MELFKLFGTIAINNTKAKTELKEVTNEAKKTGDGLGKVGTEAKKSESKLEKFGNVAGKLGTSVLKGTAVILKGTAVALSAVGTAIAGVGANAIKYNATMESYQTSFETMTGSAEKASATMERLKELGASTPFEFEDLASATQLLMNYGFSADGAVDSMMMLGDIAQGNADKMQRVATAYGQMSSAGKVSLEDIKQMIEAGFNPLQEISTTTGESMESLYDRISKGTISVDEITASMERSTSVGGKYYKSMEKQSKTLAGQFSTLKDNFQQMTGAIFGGMSNMLANNALPTMIGWVDTLTTTFEEKGINGFIEALGNVLGEGLTYITEFMPKFIDMGFKILNGLMDGIKDNKDKIGVAITLIATTLISGLSSFLVNFTDTGWQIVNSVMEGLNEKSPELIETITTMASDLLQILIDNLPKFLDSGLQFIVSIIQGIADKTPELTSQISTLASKLLQILIDNLPKILDSGCQFIFSLAQGISDKTPEFILQISTLATNVIQTLLDNLPKFVSTGLDFIVKLAEGILKAVPDLLLKLPQIVEQISTTLLDSIELIIQTGVELLTALVENLPEIMDAIIEVLPQIITSITTELLEHLDEIIDAGVELLTAIIDNMDEIIETVIIGLADLINAIDAELASDETKEAMAEAGVDIIYALLQGMVSVWSSVEAWVSDKMDWLADKFGGFSFNPGNGGVSNGIGSASGAVNKAVNNPTGNSAGTGMNRSSGSGSAMKRVGGYADGGVIPKGHIAFLEGYGAEAVVPLERTAWIDKVAQNMDSALGGQGTSQKLDKLIALQEAMLATMPELMNVSIKLNNRELGRVVRQVNA